MPSLNVLISLIYTFHDTRGPPISLESVLSVDYGHGQMPEGPCLVYTETANTGQFMKIQDDHTAQEVMTSKIAMSMEKQYLNLNAKPWYMDADSTWHAGRLEAWIRSDSTEENWQAARLIWVAKDTSGSLRSFYHIYSDAKHYFELIFDQASSPISSGQSQYGLRNKQIRYYTFGSAGQDSLISTAYGVVSADRFMGVELTPSGLSSTNLTLQLGIPDYVYAVLSAPDSNQIPTDVNDSPVYVPENVSIRVSPNPAGDQITVQSTESLNNATANIYNVYGIEVRAGRMNGDKAVIPIDDLPIGAYFGELNGKQFKFIKR